MTKRKDSVVALRPCKKLKHLTQEECGSTYDYEKIMESCQEYVTRKKIMIDEPESVDRLMRPICAHLKQEVFYVLLLDTKHGVLEVVETTKGLVDRSQVHAREIFRRAIVKNATSVIFVHNHPSGDSTPSAQDIDCTRKLVEAGKIIGISVLDHVVIGMATQSRPKACTSFRRQNLL